MDGCGGGRSQGPRLIYAQRNCARDEERDDLLEQGLPLVLIYQLVLWCGVLGLAWPGAGPAGSARWPTPSVADRQTDRGGDGCS